MKEPLVSYRQALEYIHQHIKPLPAERVNWKSSLKTTLAEDIYAREDFPPFNNSAMDGYAVRSEDTIQATPESPVSLGVVADIFAGSDASQYRIESGSAAKIMTGAPVPEGANAVIMVEKTTQKVDNVSLFSPVNPGENIRKKGEELKVESLLIPSGTLIGSIERGLLGFQGISEVTVRKNPRVTLLVTGDELVDPDEKISGAQIRNVNTSTLAAELEKFGCSVINLGIGRDDRTQLRTLIETGLNQAEVLITSGGVSAGEKDYLPGLLNEMGMNTIFHKIKVKPGKPLLFGLLDECCVFGLPGNVVSSLVSFHLFVKPALRLLVGRKEWKNPVWYVHWGKENEKPIDRTHFVRCRLSHTPTGLPIAFPTGEQGSGMLTSMMDADGFAVIPSDIEQLNEFDILEFIPMNVY